jgi:hypothetical protein
LARKQGEIVDLLQRELVPAAEHRHGCRGSVWAETGRDADSAFVRTVGCSFAGGDAGETPIGIAVEITRIPCLDPPVVRTARGVVYLTVSDTDMVESKVVALLNRVHIQDRDMVDLFLFQDALAADSGRRLRAKLSQVGLNEMAVRRGMVRLARYPELRARSIDRVVDEQLDDPAAANITAAGGGEAIFAAVRDILAHRLGLGGGAEP